MSAVLSPCGLFRYMLERPINDEGALQFRGSGPVVAIIGVNPSTADATVNDATIRKDIGFARRLGWRRIIKANKFAFRATDVRALRTAADPIGPDNGQWLQVAMIEADIIVAAWGPLAKLPPQLRDQWRKVVTLHESVTGVLGYSKPLMCFGTAADGQPRHTLMLAYSTPLVPWSPPL